MNPACGALRDRSSSATTLISEGCKVVGTLTGDCDFQVNGEVEGDCEIESTMVLAKSGLWAGHDSCRRCHRRRSC